ncbi:MAG: hypothetical protein ACF8CQ_02660 [Rhodopirellula sp. JB044]|uniref:hypothetical protein n=1 Tax=Rhodopirellula sp. JB044 TaxID=3342844 RepID=UPI00370BB06C
MARSIITPPAKANVASKITRLRDHAMDTSQSAVRFTACSMAATNMLGINSLEIALSMPAELEYRDGPLFGSLQ